MKVKKNGIFADIVIILIMLIPVTFCSGSKKIEKKNKKISAEITEHAKIQNDNISKTTCSACHKLDIKGNLIVSEGELEGSEPPAKSGSAIH